VQTDILALKQMSRGGKYFNKALFASFEIDGYLVGPYRLPDILDGREEVKRRSSTEACGVGVMLGHV